MVRMWTGTDQRSQSEVMREKVPDSSPDLPGSKTHTLKISTIEFTVALSENIKE